MQPESTAATAASEEPGDDTIENNATELSLNEELANAFDELKPSEDETDLNAASDESGESDVDAQASETLDTDDSTSSDSNAESEEQDEDSAIKLPQGWKQEHSDTWEKLDLEIQEIVLNREKERDAHLTKKTQEIVDINRAIEPYREQISLSNFSEAKLIEKLFAAQSYLSKDPVNALKWIANDYGVDLAQLTGQADENDDDLDPDIKRLNQEVTELRQSHQQNLQTQQTQANESVLTEIDKFSTAKDDSGQLLHPHFEKLQGLMFAQIPISKQKGLTTHQDILKDAYESACWADPDIRSQMQSQVVKTQTQQTQAERNAKVKKAKKASTPQSKSSTSAVKSTKGQTLCGALEEAFEELS